MMTKCLILVAALVAVCSGGNVPVAVPAPLSALTVGTYASSYNAHAVNHAIAAPYVAAPVAASPYVAPAVAAHPFAYSAYPAFGAYSAPLIAGRR
ncbi:cuticle protein 19.8-like isoform X1 [Diprion similis]|uniref:cuticle protein 19.8-like isoform X1 n=1 Tax=Diprion similis TaxID=362088 RepID=UPI001EF78373|nr:cuticle protein 19.8-like isoform X1 [Diprion similis]